MNEVKSLNEELHNVFCHYKENQDKILIDALNNVRTCPGCHFTQTQTVREKLFRKNSNCAVLAAIVILILMFASYGIWLLRSFNQANLFGCCAMSFLWPFDECPIAY